MELGPLLKKIDSLKAEVDGLRPLKPEQEGRIEKKLRLEWNYHSNALEGNKVTLGETQAFLEYGLTAQGKPLKDFLDIRGHNEAIGCLVEVVRGKEPITEAFLRELHKILLQEPYKVDAITPDGKPTTRVIQIGEYKAMPNHVRTPTGETHYYASPEETPAKMGDLMKWLRDQLDARELHPVVIAAVFHHRFVDIHPFDDGNGRMARLITNLVLMLNGFVPVIIRKEERDKYIAALVAANAGDVSDLVSMIGDEEVRSLGLWLRAARGEAIEEPDDFDKEVGLLKRTLGNIQEPMQLNGNVPAIVNGIVTPILRRLVTKLAQLDELFVEHDARLTGQISDRMKTSGHIVNESLADLDSAISRILATPGLPKAIQANFTWKDFKKAPLKNVQLGANIAFNFERLRYTIVASGFRGITYPYAYIPTAEEAGEIIVAVCQPVLDGIRRAVEEPTS